MGRPERELDPDDAPLSRFAADLRQVRDLAGKPTYRAMSRKAHRSPTTLSEAAGGRALPSWPTVEAFLLACGVTEHADWHRRWTGLQDDRAEPHEPDEAPPGPGDSPPAPRRRPAALVLAAVGAAVVVAVVFRSPPVDDAPPPASPGSTSASEPRQEIVDGADPEDTGCANDPGAVTVDAREVNLDRVPVGVVELRYSPRCGVSWPRFTPGDPRFATIDAQGPVEAHLTAGPDDDPGRAQEFSTRYSGLPVFGNVVNSTRQCVRARARLTGPGWSTTDGVTACYRGMTPVSPRPT